MKKIYILIGTRPNFIKVTRFKELGEAKGMEIKIIHTGQHFDTNMADVFFTQFGLQPDYFLNVKHFCIFQLYFSIHGLLFLVLNYFF